MPYYDQQDVHLRLVVPANVQKGCPEIEVVTIVRGVSVGPVLREAPHPHCQNCGASGHAADRCPCEKG